MSKTRQEFMPIQRRFFEALDLLISTGQCAGIKTFCDEHGLNRVKYTNLRLDLRNPKSESSNYRSIDIDALAYICQDYKVSPDWLLLNKGGMFSK